MASTTLPCASSKSLVGPGGAAGACGQHLLESIAVLHARQFRTDRQANRAGHQAQSLLAFLLDAEPARRGAGQCVDTAGSCGGK
jgi:hypothetical protein